MRRLIGSLLPFVDQGCVSAANFLTQLVLVRLLPSETYGAFIVLQGGYFLLANASYAVVAYPMMRRLAADTGGERGAIIGAALLSLLPVLGLGLVAAVLVPPFLNGGTTSALLVVCSMVALLGFDIARRIFYILDRFGVLLLIDGFVGVMQLLLIALVAVREADSSAVFAVLGVAPVIALLIVGAMFSVSFRRRVSLVRDIVSHLDLLFSTLVGGLTMQIVTWTLAVGWGSQSVATYQMVLNVLNVSNPVIYAIINVVTASVMATSHATFSAVLGGSMRRVVLPLACMVGALILVTALPHPIFSLLYGDIDDRMMVPTLRVAAGAFVLYGVDAVGFGLLAGLKDLRAMSAISLIGIVAMVVLGIPLIAAQGVRGAALALVAYAVVRVASILVAVLRWRAPRLWVAV